MIVIKFLTQNGFCLSIRNERGLNSVDEIFGPRMVLLSPFSFKIGEDSA